MAIHEPTLNQAIAAVLDGMRRNWRVSAEETILRDSGKRPDIVVSFNDRPAVLIENEFMPAAGVEDEAGGRLGLEMKSGGKVQTVVALRSPAEIKKLEKTNFSRLQKQAAGGEFDYALLSGATQDSAVRFPAAGWLSGGLADVASFVYRASVPADLLNSLVVSVEYGVGDAAKMAENLPPACGKKIEAILQQQDGEQTRRMAMVILLNALIFHEAFAGNDGVRTVGETRRAGVFKQEFLDEWEKILNINYWPIFGVACEILLVIPEKQAQKILSRLLETSRAMADSVFSANDVFGCVFQKLIADRKFLATFYTRPASAVLLANLAIPQDAPFVGGSWKKDAKNYVVADFACGTGTLLASAYQRIAELHEQNGGDVKKIHPQMMEHSLIGCDVMPAAVHLTSSILAGMQANKSFEETRLYVMPYGKAKEGGVNVGSLELLDKRSFLPVFSPSAEKAGGRGKIQAKTKEVLWESPHLVIMNPPFTSSTNHEGAHKNIPNPAFAAFGADAELQKKLGERAKLLRLGTCGNGNAGLASDFVALADKMVCTGGVTAFVLPITVMAGESWKGARKLWAKNYCDICVVSMSSSHTDECSFSADTGMAEVLFIGRKKNGRHLSVRNEERRGVFITLRKRPKNEMEAVEFARIINRSLRLKISKLEDGPVETNPLIAGKTEIGGMLDAPFPDNAEDPWEVARIRDFSIAQTAHALANGKIWFPRQLRRHAIDILICKLGAFAERGFIGRDICGEYKGVPRGPFNIFPLTDSDATPTYPCLWAQDAENQTRLIVAHDSKGIIRPDMQARAHEVWQTASRAHHNITFRFNSQSLAVATTESPTIGGTGWLNVIFKNIGQERAYALWSNSTLGLLLYWWWSNKQHSGRGGISPSRLPTMPTLDLSKLSTAQLTAARQGFDFIKNKKLLPFYRADEDETRAELDKIILTAVLGLPKTVLDGVQTVREKLCREPSVRGGKE